MARAAQGRAEPADVLARAPRQQGLPGALSSFVTGSAVRLGSLFGSPFSSSRTLRRRSLNNGRLRPTTLLSESHSLGQFRPSRGIVGSHHGVGRRQAPLGAVLVRGEV